MSLNKTLIQERLLLLEEYTRHLEKLARTQRSDFLKDKVKSAAAESYLRRALEAILDIGRHILAKSSFTVVDHAWKFMAKGGR